MEKNEDHSKAKLILATVKGDVHDIGKNLVDIILSNNGYRVVNLGIKVPPEELIRAYREHRPDVIGLSGLLVKSAQMMVATAQDLKSAGIQCPILVGGAALSSRFTRTKIAPEYAGLVAYANDAMEGLGLANRIMDPAERRALAKKLDAETERLLAKTPASADLQAAPAVKAPTPPVVVEIPVPPDLKSHVIRGYDLEEIFGYINPVMLYTRHLGFRNFEAALAAGEAKAVELHATVKAVEEVMLARADITANAVYRFFPVQSDGDRSIRVYASNRATLLETFTFDRQRAAPGLCLADCVAPRSSGRIDYLCMFVTTIGGGVRQLAEQWKHRGDYLRSHILQILAVEGAEAFAELLHLKIRQMWGFGDPPGLTRKDLFRARYRGKRYSFGYPACPRLEDQTKLFRLLEVGRHDIGVTLTEEYMMDPESSVSALVFHHPEAIYFSLSQPQLEEAGARPSREAQHPAQS